MKKLLEVTKPFVGPFRQKPENVARPILKAAYVDEKYVYTTDSRIAIRLAHHQDIEKPYLHHYKEEYTGHLHVTNYPKVANLFEYNGMTGTELKVDVDRWRDIHETLHVAAKENERRAVKLEDDTFRVLPNPNEKTFNQIAATYTLDKPTGFDIAYNCGLMILILKAAKKMKISELSIYFNGPHKPMTLHHEDFTSLLMPIRIK